MEPVIATILRKMFPSEGISFGRGYDEVNGLPGDVIPQGKIIASFVPKQESDRTFYLINIEDVTVLLRICDAMKGSHYAKFAVIHKTSLTAPTEDVERIFYRWMKGLQ